MPVGQRRKQLVDKFGGTCQRCGYSKCKRALHFHHVDSSEKQDWSFDGHVSNNEIVQHPERFILVCANCHAEIHDEMVEQRATYATCLTCGKKFHTYPNRKLIGRDKYCSRKCNSVQRAKDAQSIEAITKRFWKYVKKTDECWEWQGDLITGKFPALKVRRDDGKYTTMSAHRFSYELHICPIPERTRVIRTCDNPACVRPDHLVLKK